MYRKLVLILCLVLYSVVLVMAQDDGSGASDANSATNATNATGDSNAKTLKGMSVLGNNEAPMSLFIVPWKSSEQGVETNLNRTLNEHDEPVDRDVFMRQLDFFEVSTKK